jgi:hypothetical protein
MPTTYNDFIDKQEEFWAAVRECFEESEYKEFYKFFVPLFYLGELDISNSSHPLNLYGANRPTDENINALRIKITDDLNSCPGQLLRYMFEEEDHPIYLAFVRLINTYKELGNTLRSTESSSNSESNYYLETDSDSE